MNVLVVGGAGYIGSHTCKSLALAGHKPVVLDNLSQGHEWAIKWGPRILGDAGNRRLLDQVIDDFKIDAIFHFAAHAYVGESMLDPVRYFENNCSNSLVLIQAAIAKGVKWFVFSSSCATYGVPKSLPISEDHDQAPISPYGESKLVVEKYLRWIGEIHDLRWISLRFFNAAGADHEGEIGEAHNPETHLIPLVIEAAIDHRRPVKIFGTDYDTPDGTPLRDYVHVTDLAEAHCSALRYLIQGGRSQALNLGSGKGHSVLEVVSAISRVTGRDITIQQLPRRQGDAAVLVADPGLAARTMNWVPRRSTLENIVSTSIEWRLSRDRESLETGKSRKLVRIMQR